MIAKSSGNKEHNPVCALCAKERVCGQLPGVVVMYCPKMVSLTKGNGFQKRKGVS